MASLIQELIATLSRECTLYEQLIPVSEKKTQALVKSDLDLLQEVTDSEQVLMDEITALESVRQETIQNMSVVLGREPADLDLTTIGKILSKQPEEQAQIHALHDRLRKAAKRLVDINVQNKSLIEQSLEMVEFNVNFIQSTRMSPGTNNYTRHAGTQDDTGFMNVGSFDAKQ